MKVITVRDVNFMARKEAGNIVFFLLAPIAAIGEETLASSGLA